MDFCRYLHARAAMRYLSFPVTMNYDNGTIVDAQGKCYTRGSVKIFQKLLEDAVRFKMCIKYGRMYFKLKDVVLEMDASMALASQQLNQMD